MAVNLSPLAGAGSQFFTDAGTPLTGGLLYTYLAGTTTPAATYSDISGATANSNPIVLNAAGRVTGEVWLLAGTSYKFVLKTATLTTIGTWDNIDGVNDVIASTAFYADTFTCTAGQTTFTLSANPGSINNLTVSLDGAVLVAATDFTWSGTTVVLTMAAYVNQVLRVAYSTVAGVKAISPGSVVDASVATSAKLYNRIYDTVSVKDYGADSSGLADSAAAFNAAIAAVTNDGVVLVPAGTYRLNSALTLGAASTAARMVGIGQPTLKFYSIGAAVDCFNLAGANYRQIELRNLNIDFNTTGRDGLVLTISNWPIIDNVVLNNSYRDSFVISCSAYNWVENGEFDLGINAAGRHAVRMELAGANDAFINECLWKQLEVRGVAKITAGGQAIRMTSTATSGGSKFSNQMFLKSNIDALYTSGGGIPVPSSNIIEIDSGTAENWRFSSAGFENTGATSLAGGYTWAISGTGVWGGLFVDSTITNSFWGTLGASASIGSRWNFDYSFGKTELYGPVTTKVLAGNNGYAVTGNTQASSGSELKGTRTGAVGAGGVGNGANLVLGNDTNSTYVAIQEFGGAYLFYTYFGGTWNVRFQVNGNGGILLPAGLSNYANDAAAAAGGVAVGQLYRNGSVVQIRVV